MASAQPQYVCLQPQQTNQQSSKHQSNPQIYLTSSSSASHYVINMSRNIQQVTPFEGPDQITIDNGQDLNINSPGVSTFSSPLNPQFSLTLTNLLFVPSITKNLISVSQFCEDNVFLSFTHHFVLLNHRILNLFY